ncbi:MAG: hypothetical protein WA364_06720 [Candidatus Nitrosopolaris sp.]
MSTSGKDVKLPKVLPPPNSDFYQLAETLPPEELATLKQVRSFMESKVAPIHEFDPAAVLVYGYCSQAVMSRLVEIKTKAKPIVAGMGTKTPHSHLLPRSHSHASVLI